MGIYEWILGTKPAAPKVAPEKKDFAQKHARKGDCHKHGQRLVAFGLFSLLVGIRTDTGPAAGWLLKLSARFETLAVLVAVAFAGVFLREILFSGATLGAAGFVPRIRSSFPTARIAQFLGPGLLIFAAVVPVIFYDNRYLLDLSIQILTYVMLGWGLNIVVGLAGLLDLGYVAFYAVGAYSYALLAQSFGLSVLGFACRSPESWQRSGAFCSAFRCCACAGTISPSSR